jgi:lysophospholipase L1-like esterase
MDYTEDQYRAGLPRLLDLLRRRAPGARLIWATTTPWRKPAPDTASLHPNNERVKARNRIAAEIVTKRRLPIDDLYAPLESHPEYWSADGVHLNAEGQAVLAGCVLRTVRVALKGPEARGASRP